MRYHVLERHDIISGCAGLGGHRLTNIFRRILSIDIIGLKEIP